MQSFFENQKILHLYKHTWQVNEFLYTFTSMHTSILYSQTTLNICKQKINKRGQNNLCTCGVVTKIAPSGLKALRFSMTVICSSDVPGGVSMIRYSVFCQCTSLRNCLIMAVMKNNMHFEIKLFNRTGLALKGA